MPRCIRNSMTGYNYSNKFVGTADEDEFLLVMPLDGYYTYRNRDGEERRVHGKMYFDSHAQYDVWQQVHYPHMFGITEPTPSDSDSDDGNYDGVWDNEEYNEDDYDSDY